MTILDIDNQLVNHFLSEEKFSIKDNLSEIVISDEYIEHSKTLVVAALDSLVKNDVLVKLDEDSYLLKQPILNYTQSLSISPGIASAIADKVNMMRMDDEDGDSCNAMSLNEGDIVKLLIIIDTLLEDTGKDGSGGIKDE